MRRANVVEEFSFVQKFFIGLTWAVACGLLVANKEKIGFEEIVNFAEQNVQCIVVWTWYTSVTAASCTACVIARLVLGTFAWEVAGTILTTAFHIGLSTLISLSEPKFNLNLANKPFEEILLCITAGYCFYEMLYLRLFTTEDSWKLWMALSTVSFIVTFLGVSFGANVFLTFIFLFSSSVPVTKFPSFGSSKYVNTIVYRASVWAAYIFMIHQRLLIALPVLIALLNSPKDNWTRFEYPLYVSAYILAATLVRYLATTLFDRKLTEQQSTMDRDLEETEILSEVLQTQKRKINEAF